MKLATLKNGGPDGRLHVVSQDLRRAVRADDIAATLQEALDHWDHIAPKLRHLSDALNAGAVSDSIAFNEEAAMAPLPRAWQWLDGSAFANHGHLMQKAFNLPPIETAMPLMYQGMSHRFLGAAEDVCLPSVDDGIDFEGEFGIVTDFVPMGTKAENALRHVKLCLVINDWSLRAIAPVEMKTGFGWIQAKPACALSPVAVTPDVLGEAWRDGRILTSMVVNLNGKPFGTVPANEMGFGFHELIAHAARSRDLPAGTIIGSGTVSSSRYAEVGSACIAERRAIETIADGKPSTPFMRRGDRVCLHALDPKMFGRIDQKVLVPA
ncbi:fumarylacetoacetate FAA hydrolase family protein [Asticcacaulis biprosthecium C19]|uniref:Fumarylacetoacetate FAA hydrolase family protein n=1 Tax=Asticcacaulis biprosthecium C19 TaxID=715226 RepID=F4QT96_9CAUL|nr:fumarylacetoacetate hydrolase family protein [Asticcacaulis biprosthecium]EGF89966.1 fumarylacetoacetate FAA hydrolase family protein [Asticcacaulis biprosthecium C19]